MAMAMAMAMVTGMPAEMARAGCSAPGGLRVPGTWRIAAGAITFALATQAVAQAPAVGGADGAPVRAWSIVPRISASETYSDNAVASAAGPKADFITQLSPGIRIQGQTGRLRASVDYSLSNFSYARGSQASRNTNALNATGTLEAIEKWLYIDASGVITQQTISAFGVQTANAAATPGNSTEASSFRVSPYVRGLVPGFANYEIRYSHVDTQTKSALAAGSRSDDYALRLRGLAPPVGFAWTADATRTTAVYSGGRDSRADLVRATLNYQFDRQFRLFVSLGAESNNYASTTAQSRPTFGYGGQWSPTERTQLLVTRERRTFGDSHSVTFSHRLPLTALRFSDTRNVNILPSQLSNTGQGTYYDLYFAQLAASIPDPVARAQQVNTLLQQAGIAPNAAVTNGFATSRVSVSRRQEFSVILNGARNTATYTFFQATSQTLGATASVADDFNVSPTVTTRGMSSNFSHRLSPLTSLNAFSSMSRTEGTAGQSARQRLINVNVSTRLSPKATATVGFRATRSDNATLPYRENAVLATFVGTF